ncbi:MAG: beta-propeller domain-containing protein [Bacillota bacterium]
MFTKKIFKNIIFAFLLVFGLSACSLIPVKQVDIDTKPEQEKAQEDNKLAQTLDEKLEAQSKIKKFANVEELSEFMMENDSSSSSYYNGMRRGMAVDMVMEEAMPAVEGDAQKSVSSTENATGMGASADEGSDDFSETNVQVEGVDEADIIKTDGKYIYAVAKNNLFIINAYPADKAEIISKIEFKSRPQDIYINDDKLIVFGRDSEIFEKEIYNRFKRRSSYTYFKVFDISNKKEPNQVRDLDLEGNYFDSRMIGDYVYFVTNNYQYWIDNEPVLPRVLADGKVLSNDCTEGGKCFTPDIYYFNIPYSRYNFTSLTAINIADNTEEIKGEVYLLSGNQDMYVSKDNVYITYTKYISESDLELELMKEFLYNRLSARDQEKISKISSVENYILSENEKNSKIRNIIMRWAESLSEEEQEALEEELETKMKARYENISKELEKTVIHKIAISEGDLEYQVSGEVTGHVLNQFSMDESGSYFRIATTKNRTWSRYSEETIESYSNIYVLDENLEVVGSIEGLAPDERIYSVRFMQNRAYLVTFKQMDPLFVVDLSSPTNPKILGELKIPGYSDYLHPYDENTLIGLGKDAGETEWGGVRTKGLKLSLFDVSDVANPKEVDTYIMGDAGSDSIALRDHKAFLFSREKNLLSIPVSIRESLGSDYWGDLTFSGAAVLKVDKQGFELQGKIDHSDGGKYSERDYWRGYNYYDNTVKRALYIDDVLYTFSNRYLMMNDLSDLDELNNLKLEKEKEDDFKVVN